MRTGKYELSILVCDLLDNMVSYSLSRLVSFIVLRDANVQMGSMGLFVSLPTTKIMATMRIASLFAKTEDNVATARRMLASWTFSISAQSSRVST